MGDVGSPCGSPLVDAPLVSFSRFVIVSERGGSFNLFAPF
jgi:hypothetical protein